MTLSYYAKQLNGVIKQQKSIVFWVLLGLVIIVELFVIQRSVAVIVGVQKNQAPEPLSQSVRVNFSAFNQVLKQVEESRSYQPEPVVDMDPFGFPPDLLK
jgi:hypothetical protein